MPCILRTLGLGVTYGPVLVIAGSLHVSAFLLILAIMRSITPLPLRSHENHSHPNARCAMERENRSATAALLHESNGRSSPNVLSGNDGHGLKRFEVIG